MTIAPDHRVRESAPETPRMTRAQAIAMLFTGACLIGFAPIGLRLSEVGPQPTAFWRFLIALPFLALLAQRFDGGIRAGLAFKPVIWITGIAFGVDIALWHASLKLTNVANATLLSNLTPIVVGVLGYIAFRERPAKATIWGGILGLTGAACLAGASFSDAPQRLAGDGLAAFAAIWYGIYLLGARRARDDAGPFQVSLWITIWAALVVGLAGLVRHEAFWPATTHGWLVLAGLGILVHVCGQGSIVLALGKVPASLVAVLILLQPVVASLLAWWLFGERMVGLDWLGAILVLAGAYWAQREPPERNETPSRPRD